MSRSINRVCLLGHVGRDAETRFTASGTSVCNFPVATSRRWKDQATDEWKEQTDWHNIVLWKQDKLGQFLTKGKQVYIEGRLQTRSYDKQGTTVYITEIMADEVILLGGSGGNPQSSKPASSTSQHAQITDDETPF